MALDHEIVVRRPNSDQTVVRAGEKVFRSVHRDNGALAKCRATELLA